MPKNIHDILIYNQLRESQNKSSHVNNKSNELIFPDLIFLFHLIKSFCGIRKSFKMSFRHK